MRDFYVYTIIDPTTKTPFYIGKGCGIRIRSHLYPSNLKKDTPLYKYLNRLLSDGLQPIFRKVLEDLSESEALVYEEFFILALGQTRASRNSGPLLNFATHRQRCAGIKKATRGPNPGKRFKGIFQETVKAGNKTFPINYWAARIKIGGKYKSLGYHSSEEEAARAFDTAAVQYQEYPWLNFPEEHDRVNPVLQKRNPRKTPKGPEKSKYRGVSPAADRWSMNITVRGKTINCSRYLTEVDAARAYDQIAIYQIPSRPLNFPDEWDGITCLRPLVQIPSKRVRHPKKPKKVKCNPNYRRYFKPRGKFKGFCFDGMFYAVAIGMNSTKKHIGLFKTAEEAARAYDDAVIKYWGEGWLNFKPSDEDWIEPTFNTDGKQMSGYTGFWREV